MPLLMLASASYGGYISPIKLVVYLALVFGSLPIIKWVYGDAEAVRTRHTLWTTIVFATWALAAIIWLFAGMFLIGLAVFVVAVGAATITYVIHRNTLVPEFQRVGTMDHVRGFFERQGKQAETAKKFIFITTHNNEVSPPEPKTPEYFGYKAAYSLFEDVLWRRAYDVILSPAPESYGVAYYVDGAVLKQPPIAKDQVDYLAQFAKHLANLDVNERRKPQKGKFTVFKDERRIDWEISTAGSTAGEQVRFKLLAQQTITKLTELGLAPEQLEQLNTVRGVKQGIFIISGPHNSGVTTTFYALLRNHDAFLNSICTVEKQTSGTLPNIVQNVFKLSDSGITTYGKKLVSVVRMDPDIVGVADCEDPETAQAATTAATDAKLFYITLEADNVIKALAKWIKLVGDKNVVADTLLGISNQRILRKLCEQCRQAYEPNKDLLRKFNIPPEKAKVLFRAGKVVYDKRGKPHPCETCQETGYVGRMSVFETIMLNEELRKAIKQCKSVSDVATEFRRARMLYLQEQALRKVIAGVTSINEMVRVLASSKDQPAKAEQEAE